MRHIPLKKLISRVFADPTSNATRMGLIRAQKRVAGLVPEGRQGYIERNGRKKWSPFKGRLTTILGNKCWYTEVELIGAHLAIDHFRPICEYWFLAFEPHNYRISCQFANSPEHNPIYSSLGGKGTNFPLVGRTSRASRKRELHRETPVILDPCESADCELLAFQVDGRPILNPIYAGNAIAELRVEESKLLLNLDHPDFNTKREQLCHDIDREVRACEGLVAGSMIRSDMEAALALRIHPNAEFSTAARYYLRLHRHLDWVEEILSRH